MMVLGRFAFGLATAAALSVAMASAAPMMPAKPVPPPKPIPANFVQVSPCVKTMGVHYADITKPLAGSTIYGVNEGKPVFTEIMLTPKQFAAGGSWDNVLRPLPGFVVDHIDIDYLKNGHPGMPFAHYDLHAYYVPHAVHMKFCPNGVM
jgi:hypothetical protein